MWVEGLFDYANAGRLLICTASTIKYVSANTSACEAEDNRTDNDLLLVVERSNTSSLSTEFEWRDLGRVENRKSLKACPCSRSRSCLSRPSMPVYN